MKPFEYVGNSFVEKLEFIYLICENFSVYGIKTKSIGMKSF